MALFGSLAPRGAILKRSAASPELFEREGRALVFSSLEDLAARIDDPEGRLIRMAPDSFFTNNVSYFRTGPDLAWPDPNAEADPV